MGLGFRVSASGFDKVVISSEIRRDSKTLALVAWILDALGIEIEIGIGIAIGAEFDPDPDFDNTSNLSWDYE